MIQPITSRREGPAKHLGEDPSDIAMESPEAYAAFHPQLQWESLEEEKRTLHVS
jgi:hypothetical protein